MRINILVKVTHDCNLQCVYCFQNPDSKKDGICEIEHVKKILLFASREYSQVNIIWHGGEPLLAPKSFYEEISRLISHDLKFMNIASSADFWKNNELWT